MPIVSLPPLCVQEPWWLIYLGHEIGHHIQHDLAPDATAIQSFRGLLEDVARASFGDDRYQVARWSSWKEEIFADLCSIYSMGPWAVRAMVELELADDKIMLYAKPRYPAAVVRLELLAHTVAALGLDRQIALGDLQPRSLIEGDPLIEKGKDLRQVVRNDLSVIPACVVALTTTPIFALYGFRELYNWNAADFAPYGSVDDWKHALLSSHKIHSQQTLQAPRMIISGAFSAWVDICAIDDRSQRQEAFAQLAQRLPPLLKESREEGVRGPQAQDNDQAATGGSELGEQLAQQILSASTDATSF